jgi:hypothetical protein
MLRIGLVEPGPLQAGFGHLGAELNVRKLKRRQGLQMAQSG